MMWVSWYKGSNVPSLRSPVVNKGWGCFVFPSVLWHWWLGDRKDIRSIKSCSANPQRFPSWMGGGGGLEWYRLTQADMEKWPLNRSRSYEVCPKLWLSVMRQFWLMMFGFQFRLHAARTLHTLELMWANMVLGCIVVVSISLSAVTWFGGRTDTASFSVDRPVWVPWL